MLLGGAPAFASPPDYELRLDERRPAVVQMTLNLASDEERKLTVQNGTESLLIAPPSCDTGPLAAAGTTAWIKPKGCSKVTWPARLALQDSAGVDATAPASAWSAKHGLWLITKSLPWLGAQPELESTARAAAQTKAGNEFTRDFRLTPSQAPLALVINTRHPRSYRSGGLEMRVQGETPTGPSADRLQQKVAETWSAWKRDVVADCETAPKRIDILWTHARAGAEPGFFASSGSDVILMQHVPGDDEAEAKLRSAILLIGAHEGFHTLGGAIPGTRPAWVNESWASYFAYEAAKRHLDKESLALARQWVEMPANPSLLAAQRAHDAGDQSQTLVFYSKGARFWGEIEAVLDGPGNASGKLAALIKRSRGFAGIDWSSAEAVATYLDAHSSGRARAIVLCYLEGVGCSTTLGSP